MVHSMTGFGEGKSEADGITIIATAKSVNSRFLEVSVKIPEILGSFEHKANELVSKRLARGKVYLNVSISYVTKTDVFDITFDKPLLDKYMNTLDSLDYFSGQVGASDILMLPDVMVSLPREDVLERISSMVESAVETSVDKLIEMRKNEGRAIEKDIRKRLHLIEGCVDELAKQKEMSREHYMNKLREKIGALLENKSPVDEEKMLQEAAYLAQKSDPTEEIIRLKSHIRQFREVLNELDPVGSKLRFIMQECNREVDTIGAKGDTAETSSLVISIKEQLERIREQIHNVE